MGPRELLLVAVDVLERLNIRYFVTGSFGSAVYGEFRFTNNINIVIAPNHGNLRDLIEAISTHRLSVKQDVIGVTLESTTNFSAMHSATGLKIDFIVSNVDQYNKVRFDRANRIEFAPDRTAWFASPEDVILKKLEHFKMGASDTHLRDIASMIKISGETFDRDYLERWAKTLDVIEEWEAVKSRVNW